MERFKIVSMDVQRLNSLIRDLVEEVYKHLGSGFDEHIYQSAVAYELRQRGIRFQREVNIEIFYKDVPIGLDRPDFILRPCKVEDLIIEKPVILELKAVDKLNDGHRAQLKAYLVSIKHSSDKELQTCEAGFLINFPKRDGKDTEVELITS